MRHFRRCVAAGRAIAIAVALLLFAIPAVEAAPPGPAPSCWWDPATVEINEPAMLRAQNLPTNDTFSFTFQPIPVGTTRTTSDGTFEWGPISMSEQTTLTAYFWQRGGGKSLIELPAGYKDYKAIAICALVVQ